MLSSSRSKVLEKVRRLLRLADSSNPHEAALAAAKAQELMERHQIEEALIGGADDEPIVDFDGWDDLLDRTGATLPTWKWRVAALLARANACRIYQHTRLSEKRETGLSIVGRPSDVATVRYLYRYCTRTIQELVKAEGPGHGRTWYNNFRLGCADTLGRKLRECRDELRETLRAEATASGGGTALVAMNNALARVDARRAATDAWVEANTNWRPGRGSAAALDPSARAAGRRAGEALDLSRGRAVASGAKAAIGGGR